MTDDITSEQTCARMTQILDELDGLRVEMGRFKDTRASMEVRGASPYEVFYHAQTVYRKANQLCVELGLASLPMPAPTERGRANQKDVLAMLDAIRARVVDARFNLKIEGDDASRPSLPGPLGKMNGKTDTDTLTAILIASRQLNVMLLQPFASREGHERILRALELCDLMLGMHTQKLPQQPKFERKKRSQDVFGVLWDASVHLFELARMSGMPTLEMKRGYAGEEPSDVYDLASMIVSELEYLGSFLPIREPPLMSPATLSVVLPSHNFRRAKQLEAGLRVLRDAVKQKPDWLKKSA